MNLNVREGIGIKMQPLEKLQSEKVLAKNKIVLKILLNKLDTINTELSMKEGRMLVHNTSGRIKEVESIRAKLKRKGFDEDYESAVEKVNDIIGVRAVCFYMDDLYKVADTLSLHEDIEILKVKNYMEHPKKSGYRSLHLIIKIKISLWEKQETVKAEVQLRTFAMNYWALLDHQLRYKKDNAKSDKVEKELEEYAASLEDIDKKMMKIRDKIAQI